MVCEYKGSVVSVSVYGVLKSCGSVIVICEYNGDVVDVNGVLKSCGSVKVICEYNGDVVDVYGN